MALVADYEINGSPIKGAYFQIRRVWGSKAEGWNAQVGVAKNQIAAGQNVFDANFNVNIPYSEGAPFPQLYAAIRQRLLDKRIKAADHLEKAEPEVDNTNVIAEPEVDNTNVIKPVKAAKTPKLKAAAKPVEVKPIKPATKRRPKSAAPIITE